jgi:hypothetical protein
VPELLRTSLRHWEHEKMGSLFAYEEK